MSPDVSGGQYHREQRQTLSPLVRHYKELIKNGSEEALDSMRAELAGVFPSADGSRGRLVAGILTASGEEVSVDVVMVNRRICLSAQINARSAEDFLWVPKRESEVRAGLQRLTAGEDILYINLNPYMIGRAAGREATGRVARFDGVQHVPEPMEVNLGTEAFATVLAVLVPPRPQGGER